MELQVRKNGKILHVHFRRSPDNERGNLDLCYAVSIHIMKIFVFTALLSILQVCSCGNDDASISITDKYTSLTTPVTLDVLAQVDENVAGMEKDSGDGTACLKFRPKDGHYFKEVKADNVTIWKAKEKKAGDEKCTFVSYRRIKPERVVRIIVRDKNSTANKLFFLESKDNGNTTFKTITSDEYDSKVKDAQNKSQEASKLNEDNPSENRPAINAGASDILEDSEADDDV